jgi:glucan biosynthesis protein C
MNEINTRLYYLDAMRAILMILGVVLHSAQVFSTSQTWMIYSPNGSDYMSFIGHVIHVCRMPAFFLVSGFFCFLTLSKYGANKFISVRLIRIFIPLLFTALIINTLQEYILSTSGWKIFELKNYIKDGEYISHLWFLVNLVIYFSVAAIIAKYFQFILAPVKKSIDYIMNIFNPIALLFLLPLLSLFILSLNKIGVPLYSTFYGIFVLDTLLFYVPFFCFGMVLSTKKEYMHKFATLNPYVGILIIGICYFLQQYIHNYDGQIASISRIYIRTLMEWFSVTLCLYFFCKFFNYKSRLIKFFSDSSYTTYLFHQVLVISIGLYLIKINIDPVLGFLILMPLVLLITSLSHLYIVGKYNIASMMFNGKKITSNK